MKLMRQNPFKSLVVITDEDFFNFHERNNNEKTYKRRKRKFGTGIIFSAPYKWENDTMAYINYEIIDWDFDCGTGKYGIIEIK